MTKSAVVDPRPGRVGHRLPALLLGGGVCGLAWAAALRGFMAEVAGPESGVHWLGTFGWVLAPGLLTGVLLGWAEHLRTTGGRRGWRWLALAPLLFASVLLGGIGDIGAMLDDGVGGGAIGVPAIGMLGGYALSRRGPPWARLLCGALALSAVPIWSFLADDIAPGLALTTPRGAWAAILYWSLLATLAMACAIPHRPTRDGVR